jgi:uncharacterized protein YaaQ
MFKLVIAIIRDSDANAVANALVAADFRATRIASTGAFFRQGNTTMIIGIETARVNEVIAVIKSACGPALTDSASHPVGDGSHRAIIFVLNATQYEQI